MHGQAHPSGPGRTTEMRNDAILSKPFKMANCQPVQVPHPQAPFSAGQMNWKLYYLGQQLRHLCAHHPWAYWHFVHRTSGQDWGHSPLVHLTCL